MYDMQSTNQQFVSGEVHISKSSGWGRWGPLFPSRLKSQPRVSFALRSAFCFLFLLIALLCTRKGADGMSKALPLVNLPARTAVYRFGTPSTASRASALLRFEQGLTIPRDGRQGWAIVGDGEGRRLAVEVNWNLAE